MAVWENREKLLMTHPAKHRFLSNQIHSRMRMLKERKINVLYEIKGINKENIRGEKITKCNEL